ncbi:MAG TPA: Hsp20/alpha crystallin family protein [Anaerolineaceae bacterium]
MAISDILPWKREDKPVVRKELDPVMALRAEIDRMFDEFLASPFDAPLGRDWGTPLSNFLPKMNVSETENEVTVMMEVPGMDEKDISVTLGEDYLTVRGEKKAEKQDKGARFHRMEFSYGSFCRQVPLPSPVDADKTDATFKNGVLSIRMPKVKPTLPEGKRIEIKH